jgi:uncharacterized membrane protein
MFDTSHFHPMIVHFPVALILLGFFADTISVFFNNKNRCLSKIGFYLMILGTLGAITGYFTGEYFTEELTGTAHELKEEHELYSKVTMYVMIAASIIRLYANFAGKEKGFLKWFIYLLYAIGAVAVGYTGFLGGSLVYNFMII